MAFIYPLIKYAFLFLFHHFNNLFFSRIMKHLVATYGKQALDDIQIAYDGKANVYTTRALPFGEEGAADFKLELSIEEGVPDSKLKRFDVNIKFVKEIDMNQIEGFYRTNTQGTSIPQECLTALEVTLSYHPSKYNLTLLCSNSGLNIAFLHIHMIMSLTYIC